MLYRVLNSILDLQIPLSGKAAAGLTSQHRVKFQRPIVMTFNIILGLANNKKQWIKIIHSISHSTLKQQRNIISRHHYSKLCSSSWRVLWNVFGEEKNQHICSISRNLYLETLPITNAAVTQRCQKYLMSLCTRRNSRYIMVVKKEKGQETLGCFVETFFNSVFFSSP